MFASICSLIILVPLSRSLFNVKFQLKATVTTLVCEPSAVSLLLVAYIGHTQSLEE